MDIAIFKFQDEEKFALQTLSKSSKCIYYIIYENSLIKVKDINEITSYSSKTVRNALNILIKLELIIQVPDLTDFRSSLYQINEMSKIN